MTRDRGGVALLVDTLHHALPADAEAVLAGLDDAVLAAGLAQAGLPIAVAVGEFVAARGGPLAAAALTRRALAEQTVADPHAVLRSLIARTDPAVDEALYFPQADGPHQWARRAVLRDRVGADGRPVIDPGFRRRLTAQLERARTYAEERPHPRTRVEGEIADAVLGGDDPDLVELLLPPILRQSDGAALLRALATLSEHGRLAAAWETGLRARVNGAAKSARWNTDVWQAALRVGDAAAAGTPLTPAEIETMVPYHPDRWAPRHLPPPGNHYGWSAPGVCARHYTLPWADVLARAAHVGGGSCPGLEEAAAREDLTPAMREELQAAWSRAAFFVPDPGAEEIGTAQREAERTLAPAVRHFAVRELVIRGLTHRSLTASEVVWTLEPAAETLALATPVSPAIEAYLAEHRLARHPVPASVTERSAVDVRHAAAGLLADSLGADPELWRTLLIQAGAWTGSLGRLVTAVADGRDLPLPSHRAGRWPRGVDPAAVLLTLAPAEAADAFLAEAETSPVVRGVLTRVLDRGPLPVPLVEYALGPRSTPEMRRALARNVETGFGTLVRLVEGFPADTSMLATVYMALSGNLDVLAMGERRAGLVEELRTRIVLHSEANGGLHERLARRFRTIGLDLDELLPALASQDPVVLHGVLSRISTRIDPGHRARAYASLARLTGPEPVWALEAQRVGTLDKASASVRASMAAGDIGPLLEAADPAAVPSYLKAAIDGAPLEWGGPAAAGDTAEFATAELVRAELDGRPDRWQAVADAWTRGSAAPLDELLRELP